MAYAGGHSEAVFDSSFGHGRGVQIPDGGEPPIPMPAPDPDRPTPIPVPVPDPESPVPDPGPPSPPPLRARSADDVEIVLRGSTAVMTGVVERLEERRRIVDAVASLASVTSVEDNLRPPAA